MSPLLDIRFDVVWLLVQILERRASRIYKVRERAEALAPEQPKGLIRCSETRHPFLGTLMKPR
jgi:hypothetical protein